MKSGGLSGVGARESGNAIASNRNDSDDEDDGDEGEGAHAKSCLGKLT